VIGLMAARMTRPVQGGRLRLNVSSNPMRAMTI